MFCGKCGQQLEDNTKFCPTCGQNQFETYEDVIKDAKLFAQTVELQLLKAPATARFCSLEEMRVTESKGIFTVSGYVDAQNSYGALIRTPFTLRVYREGNIWKSADSFQSMQAAVGTKIAANMLLYWIIGLIFAGISFAVIYFMISSSLGI